MSWRGRAGVARGTRPQLAKPLRSPIEPDADPGAGVAVGEPAGRNAGRSMTLVAVRGRPLRGVAAIAGDKSCSHRALILGALASGETLIQGLGQSDDVLATVRALQAFGVAIDRREGVWAVRGGSWTSPGVAVDCGNSATTARLLMGAVAGMADIEAVFTGDSSLSRRPMRRVTEPLRRMGASIEGGNTLPIQVTGRDLGGIRHD